MHMILYNFIQIWLHAVITLEGHSNREDEENARTDKNMDGREALTQGMQLS